MVRAVCVTQGTKKANATQITTCSLVGILLFTHETRIGKADT
jgi:hypothetical protein